MNINDLTLGQVKELVTFFNGKTEASTKASISDHMIGRWVLIRSCNEGLNFGKLVAADETGCVIADARRVWGHKPADNKTAWYEGVATTGLHADSKVSCPVPTKVIVEDYSITECTQIAIDSFARHPSHAQMVINNNIDELEQIKGKLSKI